MIGWIEEEVVTLVKIIGYCRYSTFSYINGVEAKTLRHVNCWRLKSSKMENKSHQICRVSFEVLHCILCAWKIWTCTFTMVS